MLKVIGDVASRVISNGISTMVLGNDKVARTEKATVEQPDSSQFEKTLGAFLPADSSANVSEEDLFSASVGERINSLKGEDALKAYQTALESEKSTLQTASGYIPVEQATINTLKKLVGDGVISETEGNRIYTESFQAAQLDDNQGALFDGQGGDNDPTVAVAKMSEAMLKIKTYIDGLVTTPLKDDALMSLNLASATGVGAITGTEYQSAAILNDAVSFSESGHVTPNGTYVDGSEGFLFKPETINEGKLAVLFGQSWTYNISAVSLLDSAGNLIEAGVRKPEGISETGREKFTFSKKGNEYPENITVEVRFNDGSIKTFSISDPSKRYD